MAAFKKFLNNDFIVSPLEVNKEFTFTGSSQLEDSNVLISRYIGKNISFDNDQSLTGINAGEDLREFQANIYSSIKHLYYSNYVSGSEGTISDLIQVEFNTDGTITNPEGYNPTASPIYYNYEQTDLNPYKYFPLEDNSIIGVISIPRSLFGDYIKPNSVYFSNDGINYRDDGEGRIYNSINTYVGNIIYQHGIIILTGGDREQRIIDEGITLANIESQIQNIIEGPLLSITFKSSYTLYETQYKCEIEESEFNFTLNPSILETDSEGIIHSWATGSYFDPYVTTIGLYDDQYNLLAVGKLSKPLPTSRNTNTTVLVNIDRQ